MIIFFDISIIFWPNMGTLWLDYGHIGFRSSKPATTWLLQQEQASLSAPDQDFFYAKAESYEDQFEAARLGIGAECLPPRGNGADRDWIDQRRSEGSKRSSGFGCAGDGA
jgi:hypothetical protein